MDSKHGLLEPQFPQGHLSQGLALREGSTKDKPGPGTGTRPQNQEPDPKLTQASRSPPPDPETSPQSLGSRALAPIKCCLLQEALLTTLGRPAKHEHTTQALSTLPGLRDSACFQTRLQ